jgi:ketosteroid isomerase-like protein
LRPEDIEAVRAMYARWAQGEFPLQDALWDPEIVWVRTGGDGTEPAGVGGGEWRGPEEIRPSVEDWMASWRDYRIEGERFVDLGDRLLVLSRHRARGAGSGIELDQETADFWWLREGRVVRLEMHIDRLAAEAVLAGHRAAGRRGPGGAG